MKVLPKNVIDAIFFIKKNIIVNVVWNLKNIYELRDIKNRIKKSWRNNILINKEKNEKFVRKYI